MTKALAGFGAQLQIGDGSTPEVFTTIAEVRDISGPGLALDTVDVTGHDSPGGWEENIGTILRSGEVSFDINYVPTEATHDAATGLIADMVARTLRNFQLVFPDPAATTWAFSARVTGVSPEIPVAEELLASVTLKISGEPTLA